MTPCGQNFEATLGLADWIAVVHQSAAPQRNRYCDLFLCDLTHSAAPIEKGLHTSVNCFLIYLYYGVSVVTRLQGEVLGNWH